MSTLEYSGVRFKIINEVKRMSKSYIENKDPFNIARFLSTQEDSYECALCEVRNGEKRSHWMWYIFPQLNGLGRSPLAQEYGITGIKEAKEYLNHKILGSRLITISEAVLSINNRSANDIFGSPDEMKLRSCATLFAHVSYNNSVFHKILNKYFNGEEDPKTLELLKR